MGKCGPRTERWEQISHAKVASASQLLGSARFQVGEGYLEDFVRKPRGVDSDQQSEYLIKDRPSAQCFDRRPPTAPRSMPAGHLPPENKLPSQGSQRPVIFG